MRKAYRTVGVPVRNPKWNQVDADSLQEAIDLLQAEALTPVKPADVQVS